MKSIWIKTDCAKVNVVMKSKLNEAYYYVTECLNITEFSILKERNRE